MSKVTQKENDRKLNSATKHCIAEYVRGMSSQNGKELKGIDHLKQSIIDILTTPVGTRIMRRDYGSKLFELIDRPISSGFAIEIYAHTAEALHKWEKRFKLEKVEVVSIQEGKIILNIEGIYLIDGKPISLHNIVV